MTTTGVRIRSCSGNPYVGHNRSGFIGTFASIVCVLCTGGRLSLFFSPFLDETKQTSGVGFAFSLLLCFVLLVRTCFVSCVSKCFLTGWLVSRVMTGGLGKQGRTVFHGLFLASLHIDVMARRIERKTTNLLFRTCNNNTTLISR